MLDWLAEKFDAASDAARETASSVYNGVSDAAVRAGEAISDAAEWTGERAVEAADWAQDRAIEAKDWAQDRAIEARDWAVETADRVDNAARRGVRGATRKVADTVSKPGGDAHTAFQQAADAVNAARDAAANAVQDVYEFFGGTPVDAPVEACSGDDCVTDGGLMVYDPANPDGCTEVPTSEGVPFRETLATASNRAYQSQSDCCAAKRENQPDRTIYYTNGIKTDCKAHSKTLKRLAEITCAKVVGIFNDTQGGIADAGHTGSARQFLRKERRGESPRAYEGFSPAVDTITRVMSSDLMTKDEFTIFAHSEGGANTSLGAFRAGQGLRMSGHRDLVDKTKIVSMGSAAPEWQDGPQYEHYIHTHDTTPNLLGLGDSNRNSGAGATVRRFDGNTDSGFNHEPAKRPFIATDAVDAHNIDDSYLEYYNQVNGGCGNAD